MDGPSMAKPYDVEAIFPEPNLNETELFKETVITDENVGDGVNHPKRHSKNGAFDIVDEANSYTHPALHPELVAFHNVTETDFAIRADQLSSKVLQNVFPGEPELGTPLLGDFMKNGDEVRDLPRNRKLSSSSYSSTSSSSSSSSLSSVTKSVASLELQEIDKKVHFQSIAVKEVEVAHGEDDEEYLSMKALSEVVGPKIMKKVRTSLTGHRRSSSIGSRTLTINRKSLSPTLRIAQVAIPSPAVEWEQKQKLKKKRQLNRSQIKAGWRVRKALASLTPPQSANTYYLDLVKKGDLKELQGLFSISRVDPTIMFYPDCTDEHNRSALRIAIENRNAKVCEVLLNNNVLIRDSLFHAIQRDFVPGVEAIVRKNKCLESEIIGENAYFPVGITPMIFAAYCNNFQVLKILYDNGHKLPKAVDWSEGIRHAWESANQRRMLCKARSSPAYITLWSNVYREDTMMYCINRIREVRKNAGLEEEYSEFYEQLEENVEDFMCALLDQIRSSGELAMLFKYDFESFKDTRSALKAFAESQVDREKVEARLELLEIASEEKLVKFVTHYNSQLSLTYMRYRFIPFLRHANAFKRTILRFLVGFFFPIFSILYIVAPNSSVGSFLTLPTVSFHCHMMSDIFFLLLIFLNVVTKDASNEYRGAPPTAIEWLVVCWIAGKWWQEIEECFTRGPKKYFSDWWNYSDMFQLSLFTVSIILRIVDYGMYGQSPDQRIPRGQWSNVEPKLLSEAFLAWAYVFVFLRILSLTRVDRVLGPLQVSLARMMTNILQFLCIFSLVIFSFGLGLSELYWYYGTPDGKLLNCKIANGTLTPNSTCVPLSADFTRVELSLQSLFWAIFGQMDVTKLSLAGKHQVTEFVAHSLIMVYHVIAIIVLINMLIAMMARTYEEISSNELNEWKFHRTAMWIRFIRREVICPPPMNLIPNPVRILEHLRRFYQFLRPRCCEKETSTETAEPMVPLKKIPKSSSDPSRLNVHNNVQRNDSAVHVRKRPASMLMTVRDVITSDLRKQKSKRLMKTLVNRYKQRIFFMKLDDGGGIQPVPNRNDFFT